MLFSLKTISKTDMTDKYYSYMNYKTTLEWPAKTKKDEKHDKTTTRQQQIPGLRGDDSPSKKNTLLSKFLLEKGSSKVIS